ncbi:MAG TPA: hypothetical protein VEL78_08950, partial [Pyrinomonadaceae bacterium]|nr:hypothetical protein [Pyrinomonadaceae bacterium]
RAKTHMSLGHTQFRSRAAPFNYSPPFSFRFEAANTYQAQSLTTQTPPFFVKISSRRRPDRHFVLPLPVLANYHGLLVEMHVT